MKLKGFNSWSVAAKLMAGCGSLVVFLVGLTGASVVTMASAKRAMMTLAGEKLPEMTLATEFERAIMTARINFIYHVTVQKPGTEAKGWEYFAQAKAELPKLKKHVAESPSLAGLAKPTEEIAQALAAYEVVLRQIMGEVNQKRNSGPEFAKLLTEWKRLGDELIKVAGQMNRECSEAVVKSAGAESDNISSTSRLLQIFSFLAILLGGGVGFLIVSGIQRTLRSAMDELKRSAGRISGASKEIQTSAHALAQSASDQSRLIGDTASSCDQVIAIATRNSETAAEMAGAMKDSEKTAQLAIQKVEEMVTAMYELGTSSGKVSKIVKVIDEIAFQTNILALNAAVEAARAGAVGNGFAVVADEVRNLARRSADAAKETEALIAQSVETTQAGLANVEGVERFVRNLASGAQKGNSIAELVNAGSREQTAAISKVTGTIDKLDGVARTVTTRAGQSANSAAELAAQAESMRTVAESLAGLVHGA